LWCPVPRSPCDLPSYEGLFEWRWLLIHRTSPFDEAAPNVALQQFSPGIQTDRHP
jgi:hypothetical protein